MGEMLLEIPKATPNNNPFHEKSGGCQKAKPKLETIEETGIPYGAAKQYQQMAAHPDIVAQAIEEALKNGARGHQMRYKARYRPGVGFGMLWKTRPYTALHNGL